jgi:hypothetical protein
VHRIAIIVAMLVAAGCSQEEEPTANRPKVPFIESYAGDPANYTSVGFQRNIYPIKVCGLEIPLRPPFQVGDTGGGLSASDIQAPIALLENPSTTALAPEGISAQERLSFAYPSLHRGFGMAETFAQDQMAGTRQPKPIDTLAQALAASGREWSNPAFAGTVAGRSVAVECLAGNLRNPFCTAEIHIGSKGRRYRAIFPTHAARSLNRIMEIGDGLFERAEAACSSR